MSTAESICVLFTDLVGSTELASSLDPDAADDVRRAHFSVLRQALASEGGAEVKNLGDGLMVVFPAASAAVSCAVSMQQGVRRDNRASGRALGLRVGISVGEASREGEDYFGDPVIEAARLCARAEGGQILCADLVRANAGRRSPHRYASCGALELKGLPEPLETLEVLWEPADDEGSGDDAIPLPVRLAHRPTVGLIGRASELEVLEAATKRVAAGEGRELVLLAGEPGQGKTTLVSEVARRAHEAGSIVLLGRCDEEVGAPYRPFSEALTHYVAHAREATIRNHVALHGGELTRAVPALSQRLGDLPAPKSSDSDTERYLLFAAVVGLLDAAANETPVLVVLEDLHWADKPSLQLLRHLVANSTGARLLVLATYRDAELSTSHPLTEALAALHRELAGISTMDVKGLDDTGVVSFMEAAAGHTLDEAGIELAHDLYHETDGNPFFVYEMLRHLTESGAIRQDETGHWVATGGDGHVALPSSVRSVIGARVARLGDRATSVLSTAAVIGREFDLDLLSATTGSDEGTLLDMLEEAERAALVREIPGSTGRYGFRHALIQHTLYQDLGSTRAAFVHRKVGDALEHLDSASGDERVRELARHFLLATRPADMERAVVYALRAGQAALRALAPEEAVRYFSEALALTAHGATTDPLVRLDLQIGLGTAQRQTGVSDFRETLLAAARRAAELGAEERLVEAALANNRGFAVLGIVDMERVDVLEAALAALPATDSPQRARVLSSLCAELAYGPLDRRLMLAEEAKGMARRLGDAATIVAVITNCAMSLRIPSMLDQTLDDHLTALRVAEELGDPVALFWSAAFAISDSTRAARFELADRCLAIMEEQDHLLRQPALAWVVGYTQAAQAMLYGDTERCEEFATRALEVGTASGQPDAFSFYGTQLIHIRFMQGRMGEFVSTVAEVAEQNPGLAAYKSALAIAYMQAGQENEARRIVEEVAAGGFATNMDTTWLTSMIAFARVPVEFHMVDTAAQLLERLRPFHGHIDDNGILILEPVAVVLGGLAAVAGRHDEAEQYFGEAVELCTKGRTLKYALAETQLWWARMLVERGRPDDRARASELLEVAKAAAAANGYSWIEEHATAAMAALG